MDKDVKRLVVLAVFTFFLSPLFSWASIMATDETAVFASLSRMIWYSGSSSRIFLAMLVLFVPMLISFFLSHGLNGMSKKQKMVLRTLMCISCVVLYVGAMWVMPSDGETMTRENIWHGVLSFGGMFMIFLTYCIHTVFISRKDRVGVLLLAAFLVFSLVSGMFAVLNVYDQNSYVVASAVSELYVLTMLSLFGYLTYYLAYRRSVEKRKDSV